MALSAALAVVGVSPTLAGTTTAGPPSGNGVQPTVVAGNPTCGQLDPGTTEFKVEPVTGGEHTQGPLTVTITLQDLPDGPGFNWSSNIPISSVFVKGGTEGGNFYDYDPAATSDTALHAPVNPSGEFAGLSHVSFCFGAPPPPNGPPPNGPPPNGPPPPGPEAAPPPPPPGPAAAPGPAPAAPAPAVAVIAVVRVTG